jgi:hypothetical protein
MARPARARTLGGESDSRRAVSAISDACSLASRESCMCANTVGERGVLAGGVGADIVDVVSGWLECD